MKCEQCGGEFSASGQETNCPFCGSALTLEPETDGTGDSWEGRDSFFDLAALFRMVGDVLLSPGETFSRMRRAGDMGSPLLFGVALGTISMLVGLVMNFFLQSLGFLGSQGEMKEALLSTGIILFLAATSPVWVALGLFISSAIYHVVLLFVGGAKSGFEATFRVVAYVGGATSLIQIIPLCGGVVAAVWNIVAAVIGLREIHDTTTGKALLAVLLPIVFCCTCVTFFVFFVLGTGFLAALSQFE